MPYSTDSVISNHLEWLSKIFNDTNRRGLSATAELLVDKTMWSGREFYTLIIRLKKQWPLRAD